LNDKRLKLKPCCDVDYNPTLDISVLKEKFSELGKSILDTKQQPVPSKENNEDRLAQKRLKRLYSREVLSDDEDMFVTNSQYDGDDDYQKTPVPASVPSPSNASKQGVKRKADAVEEKKVKKTITPPSKVAKIQPRKKAPRKFDDEDDVVKPKKNEDFNESDEKTSNRRPNTRSSKRGSKPISVSSEDESS
jgi:hypothetical protein